MILLGPPVPGPAALVSILLRRNLHYKQPPKYIRLRNAPVPGERNYKTLTQESFRTKPWFAFNPETRMSLILTGTTSGNRYIEAHIKGQTHIEFKHIELSKERQDLTQDFVFESRKKAAVQETRR